MRSQHDSHISVSSPKMDAMVHNVGQREQEVRDVKRDISDMVRFIQRLNGDLDALIRKVGDHDT